MKKAIYTACVRLLLKKEEELKSVLFDLTAGAGNDAKSSAGDKHETAIAMMQLEHEKISHQFNEIMLQKEMLLQIDITLQSSKIIRGSLVKTDRGFFFLSVAIGRINIEKEEVIALSPQSPLGQHLMGLSVNSIAEINGMLYCVEEII